MGWADDQSWRRVADDYRVLHSERFLPGSDERVVQPALLSRWRHRCLAWRTSGNRISVLDLWGGCETGSVSLFGSPPRLQKGRTRIGNYRVICGNLSAVLASAQKSAGSIFLPRIGCPVASTISME